jgi:hypothetical protein
MSRVCPLIQPFLQIFHTPHPGDPGRDYPPGGYSSTIYRLPISQVLPFHPNNFARLIIFSISQKIPLLLAQL